MSHYVIDVESDGPIPPKFSMVCFGAIKITPELNDTFYGKTKPISDRWLPEALNISGFSREEHLTFDDPKTVFQNFYDWVKETSVERPVFWSDNIAYDWQWINYYFHYYVGDNPFGFSGRRIGDFYAGLVQNPYASSKWKKMRKTKHTHNPVDDAKGNAEALLQIKKQFNLKFMDK